MLGKRYHGWSVIERKNPPIGHARVYVWWRVRCDCGHEQVVRSIDLQSGVARACHNAVDPEPERGPCSNRLWDEYPCLSDRIGHTVHFYDIRRARARH